MITDFNLSSEFKENSLILKTSGYINNTAGEQISNEFTKHSGSDCSKVIMDLAESKVVNSIGISYLIEIIEKLNDSSGKLYFVNLDPTIEKTFNIMGLFQFAEKVESVDEALQK
jgi:anti-anti-sigma factor